ncbi:hypothetical protein EAS56_31765 [Bradyrhizobium guangzhouense]|uniref:Uncharacterized protein n=1 Tax=Bradyrhizobium guangzhouense TaxID=1325095 RepID=A0ABY0DX77_9BRAD|nr:hypothetical protein [Bradyrhizobium guangzhouense]RXH07625.1 hypothetical protein EAS56_31765 [Bradyrhizobium guangzhouense]
MTGANALSTYRAAAVKLRETAEWNRFDGFFQEPPADSGKKPGRLIPIVDANIVKFFMDPDHEARLVDSFASLHDSLDSQRDPHAPDAGGMVPQHLMTFARVTAEFMFLSSKVSIGNEARQLWREAPLIAPAHAEETASMLRQIERKIADLYRRVARMTEAEVLEVDGKRAAETVEALHENRQRQRLQELVRDMSGSFEELFGPKGGQSRKKDETTALEEGSRWLRLMRDSKLRPLLSHAMCSDRVLNPPPDKVGRLAKKLLSQKKRAALARGESSTRVSQLAWQDATVVIQTGILNEVAREMSGDGEEMRFILISGDETLHAVYADDFWSVSEADPAQYVLRHPLQYIPIMNARDIPNGYRAKALFDTLLTVLDTVTDFVTHRTRDAFALDYDFRRQPHKLPRWLGQLEMVPLRRLADLWLEATIASNALCAGLAVHDFGIEDLVERLDKFAGDKRALDPLIELHEKIFYDIDGTQLPLIAQELLTEASGALRRLRATGVGGARIPLLLRERFEDVTRNQPIDDFVVGLAHSRGEANLQELQRAMAKWPRAKALFFAGMVAAVANNFDRAARQLEHAQQLSANAPVNGPGKRQVDVNEIAYLQCVVDRMRMREESTFKDARRRLERLAESLPKASFEYARAMSERGSLFLMRYFNLRFCVERSDGADLQDVLSRAQNYLDQARRASATIVRERKDLVQGLDTQIHTNTIALQIVRSGFFDERQNQVKDVETSLGILENVSDDPEGQDYIVGFWENVARWLTAPPDRRREAASSVAAFCRSRLQDLESLPREYQAPTDAIVFLFVAKRAEAEFSEVSA